MIDLKPYKSKETISEIADNKRCQIFVYVFFVCFREMDENQSEVKCVDLII